MKHAAIAVGLAVLVAGPAFAAGTAETTQAVPGTPQQPGEVQVDQSAAADAAQPGSVTVGDILGQTIQTSAGDELGRVDSLLVSPLGHLLGVVIDTGDASAELGVQERLIMLDGATISMDGDNLVTSIETAQVRMSPMFLRDAPQTAEIGEPPAEGGAQAPQDQPAEPDVPQAAPGSESPATGQQ